jgi:hypothetical protein
MRPALLVLITATGCGGQVITSDTGAAASSDPPPRTACTDPRPLLQHDESTPSGFLACADGFRHRVEPVRCVEPQPPGGCIGGDACATDAECAYLPYGRCVMGRPWEGCMCVAGCVSDEDCGPGAICLCAGVADTRSRCVETIDCKRETDCGGGLCGLYTRRGQCGELSAYLGCLASDAGCRVDADCRMPGEQCPPGIFGEIPACVLRSGTWECDEHGEQCGPCG